MFERTAKSIFVLILCLSSQLALSSHAWQSQNNYRYIVIGSEIYTIFTDNYGYQYFIKVDSKDTNNSETQETHENKQQRIKKAIESSKAWSQAIRTERSEAVSEQLKNTLRSSIDLAMSQKRRIERSKSFTNLIVDGEDMPLNEIATMNLMTSLNSDFKQDLENIKVGDFAKINCYKTLNRNICSAQNLVEAISRRPILMLPLNKDTVGFALLKRAALLADEQKEATLSILDREIKTLENSLSIVTEASNT